MYKDYRVTGTSLNGTVLKVSLYPENFNENVSVDQRFHRSVTGRLYAHKIQNSEQREYRFVIETDNSKQTDRNNLRIFKIENTSLMLELMDLDNGLYFNDTVRIVNMETPLSEYVPFQNDPSNGVSGYKDTIIMRSSAGGARATTGPFTLDDPILGLLDKNYNVLG